MKTSFIVAIIMLAILMYCTGCTYAVDPEGTRTWALSGEEVARGIIVISTK